MDTIQLLDKIPEKRRTLLYTSDNKAEFIDYSNSTYKNRFGNSSDSEIIIKLSDFGIPEDKIREFIEQKNKDKTILKEEQSDFIPSNDFYENEKEDCFDEISINYPTNPDLTRPSFEWDRHTIFIDLPIKEYYGENEFLKGDLFLSSDYKRMYPENRFRYLNWLTDTTKPIEKSFIYLYIECLERRGTENNLDQVIQEFIILKESHLNISKAFIKKIEKAITLICIHNKRYDVLSDLYLKGSLEEISNPILNYYLSNNLGIEPTIMFSILKKLQYKLTIVKGFENLFFDALKEIFTIRYNQSNFPVSQFYSIENAPVIKEKFSNWNLNSDIKDIEYREIWFEESLNNEMNEIYKLSIERLKEHKKKAK